MHWKASIISARIPVISIASMVRSFPTKRILPVGLLRPYLFFLLLAVSTTGCVSVGNSSHQTPAPSKSSVNLTANEVESLLKEASERWNNVPHQLGGATLQGVDCSGLVQSVFDEKLAVRLPRTTVHQARAGEPVGKSSLQPGDLVFFRPTRDDRHVGIYLSDGNFLHASSSEGVTTSSLDSEYWSERWWQARRVLTLSTGDSKESSNALSTDAPAHRTGW